MKNGYRGVRGALGRAAFAALAGAALVASPAAAQWNTTWVGVAETSGDEVTILLTGASLSPEGHGLKPIVGLQGYWLDTPGEATWSATPSAGGILRTNTGAYQARVGYTFKDNDNIPIFGGDEGGVVTAAQADWWGTGALGLQGIASHNWGSNYLWSRARGLVRVMELDFNGGISVGPEVVWQGELGDEDIDEPAHYSSTQYGGVLQWNSGNNLIGVVGAGIKNLGEPYLTEDGDDSTWYAKIEFVLQ